VIAAEGDSASSTFQTGTTEPERRAYLQQAWTETCNLLIHTWRPVLEEALAL